MAKIRHRTFEIFDFLQEATTALASKSPQPGADDSNPNSWEFRQLDADIRPNGVLHITFKQRDSSETHSTSDFAADLAHLAGQLDNGSRVLLDFEFVGGFDTDAVAKLVDFNSKIQYKGSRFVLCNLEPAVRASFFPPKR